MGGAGDALDAVLAPALKKRGFANRDLLDHWRVIVPAPFDRVAAPDKLSWPRGTSAENGAVLHLRCAQSHALELAHEGPKIIAAINRYFGFVLVGRLQRSAAPFTPGSAPEPDKAPTLAPKLRQKVAAELVDVKDDGLREALQNWGEAIIAAKKR